MSLRRRTLLMVIAFVLTVIGSVGYLSFMAEAEPLAERIKKNYPDVQTDKSYLIEGDIVLRNLPYGDHARQKLDVYLPPESKAAPIILMVHGGGWVENDKTHPTVVVNKGKHFLTKGMIYASMNYRYAPEVTPLDQAEDVANAMKYVQKHAKKWGGNPDRILLTGHSAGGHLAALVSANPANPRFKGLRPWRGTLVLDSAAFDVEKIMKHGAGIAPYYHTAFGSDPELWREASPLRQLISRKAVPMLLVCSQNQGEDTCASALEFAQAAKNIGVMSEVMPVELSHGAITIDLGLPSDYTTKVDAFIGESMK